MVYFTSINKEKAFTRLETKNGEIYVIPNDDIVFVDDESGLVSVKNTASRKTVGVIRKEDYEGL